MYVRPIYWISNGNNIELLARSQDKSVYIRFKSLHVSLVKDYNRGEDNNIKYQEVNDSFVVQDNLSNYPGAFVDPLGLLSSFFWSSNIQPYNYLKLNQLIPIVLDTGVKADLHFEGGSITPVTSRNKINTEVASISVYRDTKMKILNIALIMISGNRMHQCIFHINNEINAVNPKAKIYAEDSEYNCVRKLLFVIADNNPDRIITKNDDLNIITKIILDYGKLNDIPAIGKLNLPSKIYEFNDKLTIMFPGVNIININRLMSRVYPQFDINWTLRTYVRAMFPFKEVNMDYPIIESVQDAVGIGLMSQSMLLDALYLQELWALLENYVEFTCNKLATTIDSFLYSDPEDLFNGMMFSINPTSILTAQSNTYIGDLSIPKGIYYNVYCMDLTSLYLKQFDVKNPETAIAKQNLEDLTFVIPTAWKSSLIRKTNDIKLPSAKIIGKSSMFVYSMNYIGMLSLANQYKVLVSDGIHYLALDTLNNVTCDVPNICTNSRYLSQVLLVILGSLDTVVSNSDQDEIVDKWLLEITT